jgi:DNA-binding transcriptional regulator of glucitol operon
VLQQYRETEEQIIIDYVRFNPKSIAPVIKRFIKESGRDHIDLGKRLHELVGRKVLLGEWNDRTSFYEYSINKYFNFDQASTEQKEHAMTKTAESHPQVSLNPALKMAPSTQAAIIDIFKTSDNSLHNIEVRSLLRTKKKIDLAESTVNSYLSMLASANILENVGSFPVNKKYKPHALYSLVETLPTTVSTSAYTKTPSTQAEIIQMRAAVVSDIIAEKPSVVIPSHTDAEVEDIAFSIMKEKGCTAMEAVQRATIRLATQQVLNAQA